MSDIVCDIQYVILLTSFSDQIFHVLYEFSKHSFLGIFGISGRETVESDLR